MGRSDPLKEYREKRNFRRTGEPKGGDRASSDGPLFVVQKHDARNLHYDVRLEVDGVLKSWAVPKGPSTDPSVKRLAIPTEDHPLEYAEFEGVVAEGEYGAGTVMVWDRGTYRNRMAEKDEAWTMSESLRNGHIEVELEGDKLRGDWVFIRTGEGEDARWLLIKMKDDEADRASDVTADRPESALSGRTLEEIRRDES